MAIPSATIKKRIPSGVLSSVCKVKIPEFFICAFLVVPDFWQNIRLPFECRIQRKAHF
jgi:hypothetical protein